VSVDDDELQLVRLPRQRAIAPYEDAYDAVDRDYSHYLAVVRDEDDRIVGTMQLTVVVRALSRGGATRLQIDGVRVAAPERCRGGRHGDVGMGARSRSPPRRDPRAGHRPSGA